MLFIAALFMSDNISTTAADQEIRVAVEHIKRSEERVRRPECWPEADQPEAAASEPTLAGIRPGQSACGRQESGTQTDKDGSVFGADEGGGRGSS